MNDFSTPRRMGSGAFIMLLMKSLRELFGPFLIAIAYTLFKSHDSWSHDILKAAVGIGALFVISILIAFFRYYYRKFHIEGDKLIYTHGFASKETTSIPLSQIHTLRTKSGVLYRLLDMRGVSFDTLATDKEEMELILDETDWQKLLRRVSIGEESSRQPEALPPPAPVENESLRVSNLNLIKGALCQNHLKGFAVLAAIAAAFYDKISQLGEDTADRIYDFIDGQIHTAVPSIGMVALIAVVIYLFVMLLWIGKIFLHYGEMNMKVTADRLTIESGILSRYTSRLARDKISVLAIKQNPLEKAARCQTIFLHQAANVTGAKMEKDIRIYGSNLSNRMLGWWLSDSSGTDDKALLSARSGKGLFMRKFFPHVILATAVLTVMIIVCNIVLPAVIICSAYAVLMAARAAMAWRHSRIELTNSYVKVNRGNIARIEEYIKYKDIESVMIRRTPLSPRTHRVSIHISTNAGVMAVYSLEAAKASAIRDFLLTAISRGS